MAAGAKGAPASQKIWRLGRASNRSPWDGSHMGGRAVYGATKMRQGRLKGWPQGGLTSPLSRLEGELPALAACRQMVPAARQIPSLPAPEPRSFGDGCGAGAVPSGSQRGWCGSRPEAGDGRRKAGAPPPLPAGLRVAAFGGAGRRIARDLFSFPSGLHPAVASTAPWL